MNENLLLPYSQLIKHNAQLGLHIRMHYRDSCPTNVYLANRFTDLDPVQRACWAADSGEPRSRLERLSLDAPFCSDG